MLFKALEHKHVLKFTGGIIVGDANKHVIFDKTLKFTPFCDIIFGKNKKNLLIGLFFISYSFQTILNFFTRSLTNLIFHLSSDVIRMIEEIGYTQIQSGSKNQQINLVLKELGYVCHNYV